MALNHYVPNFILRNFAGKDGALWIMDKTKGCCWAKKGGGDSYDAFAEHDYNPSSVEEVLTNIESKASRVVRKIIDFARQGMEPAIDAVENGHLCTFLFVQALRIPRVKSWVMNREWEFEGDRKELWKMFSNLSEGHYPAGLEAEVANVELREHEHLEQVMWLRMMDMSIDVVKVNAGTEGGFLISDEPCLMKRWLVASGDRVVMPLAKNVYIQLSRPEDSPGGMHGIRKELVEGLNLQSYLKAQRFIAGSSRECLDGLRDLAESADRPTGGLVT